MPLNLIGIVRHYTENVPTFVFMQSSDTAELVTDDPCRI